MSSSLSENQSPKRGLTLDACCIFEGGGGSRCSASHCSAVVAAAAAAAAAANRDTRNVADGFETVGTARKARFSGGLKVMSLVRTVRRSPRYNCW